MRLYAPYPIAFLFLCLPFFTNALEAGNAVVSKEFIAEPPTLISLGFEWQISGDDNRNAQVADKVVLPCLDDGACCPALPLKYNTIY